MTHEGLHGGSIEASFWGLAARFGGGLAAVTAVFVLGRLLIPRLMRMVVATGIRELFILGGLAACLALAWFTARLGAGEIPVEEGGGEFIIYVVCDDPACGSATAVQVNDPELFVDAWDPVDEPGPLVHVLNGEVG